MKYFILIALLFIGHAGFSQGYPNTDSLRTYNIKYITNNAATAFTNLRLHTLLRGIIDHIDTARSGGGGAIGIDTLYALNDSTIRYRKNGVFRNTVLKGVYDTRRKVDTAYALNDSTLQIKINGTNRNIILPGRHWTLQGVLNNGSTLTENEVITLSDSLTITSGWVIIDSLNLPSLPSSTDTTANKPIAIDASGNVVKFGSWPGGGSSISGLTAGRITLSTGSTTIGDDGGLLYNSTTNKLTTDSIRNIKSQTDTIYSAVMPAYIADTIYFFGDSYTTGTGATSNATRWTTQLTGWLNLIENNLGVSGSTLEKRSPTDPYGAVNMIDRLNLIPTYGANKGWIVMAYGFNDVGYNNANYIPSNFRIDYQTVIDTIIARGWPRHRVVIVGPYYGSADTYSAYNSLTGTPLIDRARHLAFIDSAQATATFNGTKFVNSFTAELANDSVQLITGADNIHANNWGHAIIAQSVYTALTDTVKSNGQTLAINGKSEFQNIYISNQDTVAWDAPVLGIGANNKIGYFNNNKIIRATSLLLPQAGNVNLIGKGLFGNVSAANGIAQEKVIVNGGVKGDFLRAGGSLPGGLAGSAVEIGMIGSAGYLGAYDRTGGSGLNLFVNPFGAVVMGSLSPSGSSVLQVTGNTSVTDKLRIGDLSTPTMKFEVISNQAMLIPVGTTGQQPAGVAGYFRYNSTLSIVEWYNGSAWVQPATSGADGNGIYTGSGSLPGNVIVTGGANGIEFTSTRTGTNYTVDINNTSTGRALNLTGANTGQPGLLNATTTGSGGVAITGTATTGYGVHAVASGTNGRALMASALDGTGVYSSATGVAFYGESVSGKGLEILTTYGATNSVSSVNSYSILTTGTAANGIGGANEFLAEMSNGSSDTAARVTWEWTNATASSQTGALKFWTKNNAGNIANRFQIQGDGKVIASAYGAGTFTGTPATTPVYTSSGDIIERVAPKIYTALISQAGTSDPTVTVLGTNEIGTIVWTRSTTGVYVGTLTGAFTANKTWCASSVSDEALAIAVVRFQRTNANAVTLYTSDNTFSAADVYTNISIRIEVYP